MRFYSAAFLWLCVGGYALADTPVVMVTGPKTGTYYAFGKDISSLAEKNVLSVKLMDSEGSVDNIRKINQSDGAMVGIVQSDVLGFLSRSQNPELQKILSKLRVVLPFYLEEVHVLARKDISDFKDLQGKKVAIGEEGSGHMLTAVNLFAMEQIVPADIQKISPEEGVVEVLRGDVDAVIYVGGKPVKLFKNLEDLTNPENRKYALLLQQVHFLPMNSAKFYEEYEPAEITPKDYMFVKKTIPTIAVQAALVTMDNANGKSKKERCDTLKKLTALITSHVNELKQSGHPKWREIDFNKVVQGWKKSECVA